MTPSDQPVSKGFFLCPIDGHFLPMTEIRPVIKDNVLYSKVGFEIYSEKELQHYYIS